VDSGKVNGPVNVLTAPILIGPVSAARAPKLTNGHTAITERRQHKRKASHLADVGIQSSQNPN
jgi:hypothetical protein